MRTRHLSFAPFFLGLSLALSGCGGSSYSGTGSGGATAPSIQTQPSNQTVTAGLTATFSVTATGTAPLSYQWQKGTTAISGATSASYTTPATTLANSGSQYSVVVSNTAGNITSNAATLTVNTASGSTDVLTYHNDIARTGQNLTETVLTTSNVASSTFGKLGFFSTPDGLVDAEPLYASNVAVPDNGTHNILIVATEGARSTLSMPTAARPSGARPCWVREKPPPMIGVAARSRLRSA